MSTVRKVLDLHGQPATDLARELEALPPGRYVLVPENEIDPEVDADDLTGAEREQLLEALARYDRGETAVSAADSRARVQAILQTVRSR